MDLLVKDCKILVGNNLESANVGIEDGKIATISKQDAKHAGRCIDARGKILVPGMIDLHVHFREPGYESKEDFASGSKAALLGGVTTAFDMPNTFPLVDTVSRLLEKIQIASRKSLINFGLYAILTNESVNVMEDLHNNGAIGFKAYLSESQLVKTESSPPSDYSLYMAFRHAARTGAIVAVHAENNSILDGLKSEIKKDGAKDIHNYLRSRPDVAEEEAISRAAILSKESGARLHICHVSSARGAYVVKDMKAKGANLSAETCPHYLFTDTESTRIGAALKQTPPVRTSRDSEALLAAVIDDTIDAIASDHSPHVTAEKTKGNVWEVLGGFPGVETTLPLLLTEVTRSRLSLETVIEKTATGPARIWGLGNKGQIGVGFDADLVLVDLKARKTIKGSELASKCKVTPFEGFEVQGLPVCTIVNGNVVMQDGEIHEESKGRLVKPPAVRKLDRQ